MKEEGKLPNQGNVIKILMINTNNMDETLLEIKNLTVQYKSQGMLGLVQLVHAVNNLSLSVKKGEILAIAGESGCGKSTLAKTILLLENPTSGEIIFKGNNIISANKSELKNFRKQVQMIFQNPYSSLNPKMKIYDTLKEPLKINTNLSHKEIDEVIKKTIKKTGLSEECLNLYPHEFSGGQRQRIAIARSLILNPEFILADEPVSALDVSIQAQIINLLKTLKQQYNLTFLFISHDLSVIKHISDRVAIMYLGEIVELGSTNEIFHSPKHPYTKALLSSVPKINGNNHEKIILEGDLPSPTDLPIGCKFHTRCPYCMPICRKKTPNEKNISNTHYVKCFLYDENP